MERAHIVHPRSATHGFVAMRHDGPSSARAIVNNNFVNFLRCRYFVLNVLDNHLNVAIEEKRVSDNWDALKSYLLDERVRTEITKRAGN